MSVLQTSGGPSMRRLAVALHERGLAAPAVLLIEMLKPWRFVASQFLLLSEPLWGLAQRPAVRRYAAWIDDPCQVEALLDALERPNVGPVKTE